MNTSVKMMIAALTTVTMECVGLGIKHLDMGVLRAVQRTGGQENTWTMSWTVLLTPSADFDGDGWKLSQRINCAQFNS